MSPNIDDANHEEHPNPPLYRTQPNEGVKQDGTKTIQGEDKDIKVYINEDGLCGKDSFNTFPFTEGITQKKLRSLRPRPGNLTLPLHPLNPTLRFLVPQGTLTN